MTKNEEIASSVMNEECRFRKRVMTAFKLMMEMLLTDTWVAAFFAGYLIHDTVYVIIPLAVMLGCGMLLVRIASSSRRKTCQK